MLVLGVLEEGEAGRPGCCRREQQDDGSQRVPSPCLLPPSRWAGAADEGEVSVAGPGPAHSRAAGRVEGAVPPAAPMPPPWPCRSATAHASP